MADDFPESLLGNLPSRPRRPRPTFRLGDEARVKSGPLASFVGRVEGINLERSLPKVAVEIFGRVKPLKLSFSEVEKVSAS